MMEHDAQNPRDPEEEREQRRREVVARTGDKYEKRDVPSKPLLLFMAGVLVALVIVHIAIAGLGFLLYRHYQATTAPASELMTTEQIPPAPRLQSSPRADMARLQAWEMALLSDYGWANPTSGTVRIPIEQAMGIVAREGLPAKRQDIPTTVGSGISPNVDIAR